MAAWDLVTYCLALCVFTSNRKTLELPKDKDVVVFLKNVRVSPLPSLSMQL